MDGVSPSGWSQDASKGLPRRRASARLQAVPLVCCASGGLAVLDLGPLPWSLLTMTKLAKGQRGQVDKGTEKRAAGAGLKES